MAAATAPNPLLVLARVLGILVMIPVGVVGAILLIVAATEIVYFFHNRPVDAASLATKANVDLGSDLGSLSDLKGALGPPTGQMRATEAENATEYWWGHDEAVRVEAVDDGVVSVEFGARKQFQLLPYQRPVFPGALFGLRVGQSPPSAADANALEAKAKDCCDGGVGWDLKDGRIAALHFHSDNYFYQYMGK